MKIFHQARLVSILIFSESITFRGVTATKNEDEIFPNLLVDEQPRSLRATKPPRRTCNNVILPRLNRLGQEIVYSKRTYEQWANYWFYWLTEFNATSNPLIDTTGDEEDIDQPDGVFLLAAGSLGFDRYIPIKKGTRMFFPVFTKLVAFAIGDESDPTTISLLALLTAQLTNAGIVLPSDPTLGEVLSITAKTYCENLVYTNFTVRVDKCMVDPFQAGLQWTKPDDGFVLQNGSDFSYPTNNFNAVQCGYNAMVKALEKGPHVIHTAGHVESNNNTLLWSGGPVFSRFSFTYAVDDHFLVI